MCWHFIGKNKKNNRCKSCQNFNRYYCEQCSHSIKIPLNKNKNTNTNKNMKLLCEYCNGEFKRINDMQYQFTSDYNSKFKLTQKRDLYGNKIIIPNKLHICMECYKSYKNKLSKNKYQCHLCSKFKSVYFVDKTLFLKLKNKCSHCQKNKIYSDVNLCVKCQHKIVVTLLQYNLPKMIIRDILLYI